jgi:hypothetical protein
MRQGSLSPGRARAALPRAAMLAGVVGAGLAISHLMPIQARYRPLGSPLTFVVPPGWHVVDLPEAGDGREIAMVRDRSPGPDAVHTLPHPVIYLLWGSGNEVSSCPKGAAHDTTEWVHVGMRPAVAAVEGPWTDGRQTYGSIAIGASCTSVPAGIRHQTPGEATYWFRVSAVSPVDDYPALHAAFLVWLASWVWDGDPSRSSP